MGREAIETFLQKAIRANFGCESRFLSAEPIVETFEGETVWDGIVHVFELEGHPTAERCYAWSAGRTVMTVLGEGQVDSPRRAVQAAILSGENPTA